jgi:hypothetical protein
MSPTGILPVVVASSSSSHSNNGKDSSKDTGGTPVRLMGGTPMLRRGASTVEYVLLLALVGLPSLVLFRALLKVMAAYYNMVVFVETLPMP